MTTSRLLLPLPLLLGLACLACAPSEPSEPAAIRRETPRQSLPTPPLSSSAAALPPAAVPVTIQAKHDSANDLSVCPAHLDCDYEALLRNPAPPVTAIRVEKAAHRLHLLAETTVVKSYRVALGFGGAGPKLREGDGATPVGTYKITGRLPTSPWHLLIGVSYPNYEDVKRLSRSKAEGKIPHDANIGFGIALHGRAADARDGEHKSSDWTAGCIAVDNDEIEEISKLVRAETTITIVD